MGRAPTALPACCPLGRRWRGRGLVAGLCWGAGGAGLLAAGSPAPPAAARQGLARRTYVCVRASLQGNLAGDRAAPERARPFACLPPSPAAAGGLATLMCQPRQPAPGSRGVDRCPRPAGKAPAKAAQRAGNLRGNKGAVLARTQLIVPCRPAPSFSAALLRSPAAPARPCAGPSGLKVFGDGPGLPPSAGETPGAGDSAAPGSRPAAGPGWEAPGGLLTREPREEPGRAPQRTRSRAGAGPRGWQQPARPARAGVAAPSRPRSRYLSGCPRRPGPVRVRGGGAAPRPLLRPPGAAVPALSRRSAPPRPRAAPPISTRRPGVGGTDRATGQWQPRRKEAPPPPRQPAAPGQPGVVAAAAAERAGLLGSRARGAGVRRGRAGGDGLQEDGCSGAASAPAPRAAALCRQSPRRGCLAGLPGSCCSLPSAGLQCPANVTAQCPRPCCSTQVQPRGISQPLGPCGGAAGSYVQYTHVPSRAQVHCD